MSHSANTDFMIDTLLGQAISVIHNYVLPGLDSYLLREEKDGSKTRIFHMTREQFGEITPHSHRFDLTSRVLRGTVWNTLWTQGHAENKTLDYYRPIALGYQGQPGKYEHGGDLLRPRRYERKASKHGEGTSYFMTRDDIHSIQFSRDAIVMVTESAPQKATSVILEPHVNGETLHTMHVQPWMFKRS